MELINEIISLYQKGESIEKISSTLYLTPAFINYIIDLSKDYSAAKIIEKFKNMAEERPKDVSIPELKELIYKGFMPHMMAYLLKTDKNVIDMYLKKFGIKNSLQDTAAYEKSMETKRKYFKEEPLYTIKELAFLKQFPVELYTICSSMYFRAFRKYEKACQVLYDYIEHDGEYLLQDLATKYKLSSPAVGSYINLRDKRKLALQILNEEELKKLLEINRKKALLDGRETQKYRERLRMINIEYAMICQKDPSTLTVEDKKKIIRYKLKYDLLSLQEDLNLWKDLSLEEQEQLGLKNCRNK